jgi:hypothetical protein
VERLVGSRPPVTSPAPGNAGAGCSARSPQKPWSAFRRPALKSIAGRSGDLHGRRDLPGSAPCVVDFVEGAPRPAQPCDDPTGQERLIVTVPPGAMRICEILGPALP